MNRHLTSPRTSSANTRSNDLYGFTPSLGTTDSTVNGLNRVTQHGAATLSYTDNRGNLTNDGAGRTFVYDSENRLVSGTGPDGPVTLTYDPLGRLYSLSSGGTVRRFLYDGHTLIAEYGATGSQPLRRYVHGAGTDEPIAYFEGPEVGLTSRTYPHQDERGSVVAVANADGTLAGANVYDEYGASQGALTGRFGYTGQVRLPSLGLYYYRARMYDPGLGRFLQTDPIGYGDGMNIYAYVGGDPVNGRDPSGLCTLWSSNQWLEFKTNGEFVGPVTGPTFYTVTDCELSGGGRGGFNPFFGDGGDGGGVGGGDGSSGEQPGILGALADEALNACPLVPPSGRYDTVPPADARFAPEFADVLGAAFLELNRRGVVPLITSGFRTSEDQARMRAGGSGSNPAARVSLHQVGLAVDINTRTPHFPVIRSVLTRHGLTWGGGFRRVDRPHFQLPPANTAADPRQAAACERGSGR